jgi:hypothetical protein
MGRLGVTIYECGSMLNFRWKKQTTELSGWRSTYSVGFVLSFRWKE